MKWSEGDRVPGQYDGQSAQKQGGGQPVTARTAQNGKTVQGYSEKKLTLSAHCASQELNRTTCLNGRLKKRHNFANLLLDHIDFGSITTSCIWFGNEVHFHFNGYVNKQNWHHWGSGNPSDNCGISTPSMCHGVGKSLRQKHHKIKIYQQHSNT